MINFKLKEYTLKYLFKSKDFKKNIDKDTILKDVQEKIEKKEILYQSLKFDKEKILKIDKEHDNKWLDTFVLRAIYKNFSRIYKIKQSNRQSIIKIFKTLLQNYSLLTDDSDLKNINIFKTDIENFFESVNRDQILENINKSRILGYEPKKYIKQFFEYLKKKI
jgi:hypothetical protein